MDRRKKRQMNKEFFSPKGQKQSFRYFKTVKWAMMHSEEEILAAISAKTMEKYPVDAKNEDELVAMLNDPDGPGFRSTGISKTDYTAFETVLKYKKSQKP